MKWPRKITWMFVALLGVASPAFATVYLDDFWADGSRNVQNPPTESAWFSSTGSALTATPGSMTLSLGGSADISGLIPIPGSGDTTNNYHDTGGATNNPSRYYRIRLEP